MNSYSDFKLFSHPWKIEKIKKVYSREIPFDDSPPISIEIHLTNLCNLNCYWCAEKNYRMDNTTLNYNIIERIFDDIQGTSIGVTLDGGGEPTLHPNFSDIINCAKKNQVPLGLITNGIIDVSEHTTDFNWIRVSLDASNSKQFYEQKKVNRYNSVIDNITRLCKYKSHTNIGVSYALSKNNIEGIYDIILQLDEIGVDYIYIRPIEQQPIIDLGTNDWYRITKMIGKLENKVSINIILNNKYRTEGNNNNLVCLAHSLVTIIRSDGSMYLCEKRFHDPIVYGNIKDGKFFAHWYGAKRKQATKRLLMNHNQTGCGVCRLTKYNNMFVSAFEAKDYNFI